MTRQEILDAYLVDNDGMIRSPGKFEGEMLYVPYVWEYVLEDGESSEDCRCLDHCDCPVYFRPSEEDRKEFPELAGVSLLHVWEMESGFVCCEVLK